MPSVALIHFPYSSGWDFDLNTPVHVANTQWMEQWISVLQLTSTYVVRGFLVKENSFTPQKCVRNTPQSCERQTAFPSAGQHHWVELAASFVDLRPSSGLSPVGPLRAAIEAAAEQNERHLRRLQRDAHQVQRALLRHFEAASRDGLPDGHLRPHPEAGSNAAPGEFWENSSKTVLASVRSFGENLAFYRDSWAQFEPASLMCRLRCGDRFILTWRSAAFCSILTSKFFRAIRSFWVLCQGLRKVRLLSRVWSFSNN